MEESVFQWKETKEGEACILGGYGASPFVVVPQELDGIPVTSIGEYCFSDSGKGEGSREDTFSRRKLSGKFIQKIFLPDSVRKIGNLAFYNCTGLRELQIGAALTEFGSDAFMNCLQLETVRLRCGVGERTGLKRLLGQRTSDTKVVFERDGKTEAVLIYPEYYEMYDEVGPAHIFALNLTGEGFRARQCFQDGIVDLGQYDRIFEQAVAEENPSILCRMAVNRLCYPAGLSQEAERRYRDYIREWEGLLVRELVGEHDLEILEILFRGEFLTREGREKGIRFASEQNWPEGVASMLRQKAADGDTKDRYSF